MNRFKYINSDFHALKVYEGEYYMKINSQIIGCRVSKVLPSGSMEVHEGFMDATKQWNINDYAKLKFRDAEHFFKSYDQARFVEIDYEPI